MRLTDCERIIMNIIWAADHDLALYEIVEVLNADGRYWRETAISAFLRRLRAKEVITRYRKKGVTFYRPIKENEDLK
ncbi:BlaI/MecI/CopY family transcriptional regulator [Hominifimenecus sp. rT4P-3]|uniref:BlaI/MecI/CopY family transcriptional regulator n=1 Tax=Hominifimenecus sp. rT4P-3 TaxID=3242979 RepID=UPI003DA2F3B1